MACGAALHEWRACRDAQPVDVAARVEVVEAVEDDVLGANEVQAEARLFNVGLGGG
jgi:hypothetical protein